jgi:hypothetical protein
MGFYILCIILGLLLISLGLCLVIKFTHKTVYETLGGIALFVGFIVFSVSLSFMTDYVEDVVPDFKVLEAEYKYNKVLDEQGVLQVVAEHIEEE